MQPTILPTADLMAAFSDSDGMGQFIVVIQMLFSFYAWAWAISRSKDLGRVSRRAAEFRHYFGRSRSIVDYFFTHASGNTPILKIYTPATEKLVAEISESCGTTPLNASEARDKCISEGSYELVKGVAEESLAQQNNRLEDGMGLMGAIATLTPLLGLFGTVWGVLNAFQDMGRQGVVNLATVAPALSTAMLTTVVGVAVAIPTILAYNFLASKIEKVKIQFDGFADEYLGRLKREFREGGVTGTAKGDRIPEA